MPKRLLPKLSVPRVRKTPEYKNLLRHILSEHRDDQKDIDDFRDMLDEMGEAWDPGEALEDYHNNEHRYADEHGHTTNDYGWLDHTHSEE